MKFSQKICITRCGIIFYSASLLAFNRLAAADFSGDWELTGKYLGGRLLRTTQPEG